MSRHDYLPRCLSCGCEVEDGEELCSYCLAKEQKDILRNRGRHLKNKTDIDRQRTQKRNTKPRNNN